MALFTLAPGMVSRAVAHRSVEEIWYVTRGRGRMWRRDSAHEEIVDLVPGLSIAITDRNEFPVRSDGDEAIEAVGVTMPPWPGMDEAYACRGNLARDGLMREDRSALGRLRMLPRCRGSIILGKSHINHGHSIIISGQIPDRAAPIPARRQQAR